MKKLTTRTTDPLESAIDFSRFGPVRRNAFAGADEPDGPSLLALWEMPELTAEAVLLRRGHPGRGRKRETVVRSIRLCSRRSQTDPLRRSETDPPEL